MQQIEHGIYYEDSYLGVTLGGLVYSHGTIFIDAPLRAEDARSWRSALLNQRGGAHRLLVNLDAHPDRTLGDRTMDATIVAQQKTVQVFKNRPTIFKGHTVETGAAWESYGDAVGIRWTSPDITFSQHLSLFWGGPEIVLEHHPGPTPGAIWVIIPSEQVVFVGDAVVLNQPPFLAGAEISLWLEALEILAESYADYMIISGRGGPAPNKAVRAQQDFLKKVQTGLEGLARQNSPADATEALIPDLLAQIEVPDELLVKYRQRLRHGLYHYYTRHFRGASMTDLASSEEEESN